MTEVRRPTQAVGIRKTDRVPRGREDWPDLPVKPIASGRRWRRGLLAPDSEISRTTRWTLRTLSLLVPLAVWVALTESGAVDETFLPTVGATWDAGVEMAKSGELARDTWATVRRVLLGFAIALGISVPLGFAMGTWRWALAALEPIIGLLRYMPAAAFIPLLIIWLGLDEAPKLALLVIAVVFFNTLMTADVVKQVPHKLLEASMTLGATPGVLIRKVVLPYSLPGIIDAARVNTAAAWNFVIVAELIAPTEGLGYRITRSQRFLLTDRIFAVLIVIGLMGIVLDVSLRLLRDRVGRWTR